MVEVPFPLIIIIIIILTTINNHTRILAYHTHS